MFVINILLYLHLIQPAPDRDNYLIYHENIIHAEQLIAEEKFQEALKIYESTIHSFDFVFLRDYKVATQLALIVGEMEKTFYYLRAGLSKGWTLKDVKKNKFLAPLRCKPKWKDIKCDYDSLQSVLHNILNDSLREQVQQMFRKDQKKAIGALLRIGQRAKENYAKQKFAPHSEKQMAILSQILVDYGYPGERLIGNNWWVATIISHHNSISKEYVSRDRIYPALKSELLDALKNGEMSPFEFALMEDWKTAVESGHQSTSYGYLGSIESESILHEVNQNRRKIGLRSIELRNALIDIQEGMGMNLYLPGEPWREGKIAVASMNNKISGHVASD
jgi:hypothetical protein